MAQYSGTVVLTGMISPTDTTDSYPTHEDTLGRGGFMSVVSKDVRDSIPEQRRKSGMLVYVQDQDILYQLRGGTTNSDWYDFNDLYGGSTSSSDELVLTDITVSNVFNTIFTNTTVPSGEVLYVLGNDGEISLNIKSGILETVLEKNKTNDFILVFDENENISVYANSNVNQTNVSDFLTSFPQNYSVTTYSISNGLQNMLTDHYTDNYSIYTLDGIFAAVKTDYNLVEIMIEEHDLIVVYDGTDFTVYINNNVDASGLIQRKILK